MGTVCCTARPEESSGDAPKPLPATAGRVQLLKDGHLVCHEHNRRTTGGATAAPRRFSFCCRRWAADLPRAERRFSTAGAQHAAIVADVRSSFPSGSGDWIVDADAQRMLVATEGDDELARKKLKQAAVWREATLDGWVASEGTGRKLPMETRAIALGDGRPLLYVGAVHQVTGEVPPKHFATVWQQTLACAPPCTQMDFVMDCFGFRLLLNLHIGPWLKLAPSLDSYFAERFLNIIVLDMPAAARFIWNAIKPILPPKTRNKIHFYSYSSAEDMELLYGLCRDEDSRQMLKSLLEMNRKATSKTGRHRSHAHTRGFLERQVAACKEKTPEDAAWVQTWLDSAGSCEPPR